MILRIDVTNLRALFCAFHNNPEGGECERLLHIGHAHVARGQSFPFVGPSGLPRRQG